MPLNAGDIAFVGFNADGNDNIAFVALTAINSGEVIYFEDNEWTGTSWRDLNESAFSWTATTSVDAGTVVQIDDIGSGVITASTGTTTTPVSGRGTNRGLGVTDEVLYAYQGSASSPTFITAIANGGFNSTNGLLTGTGLTAGVTAIDLSTLDDDADIAAYNGTRTGQATFSGYRALVNNPANWIAQDGTGNQSNDGIAPDVPFNATAFTISGSNPTVNLSVSTLTGTEADTTAITVTATAAAPVSGNQTVTLDVSGMGITTGDYSLSNTTITIPAGQTTGFVTFTIVDDKITEVAETATLTIGNPSAGIALGSTISQAVTITDNDNPPTDITLSPTTIDEHVAANTIVGTFSTTDLDGGSFNYELLPGVGDSGNSAFELFNNELRIKNSPDYETNSSYSIRVRTTDSSDLWTEKTFTIAISNLNDAPLLLDTPVTLRPITRNAGAPVRAVGTSLSRIVDLTGGSGQNNITDPDAGAVQGIAITAANTSNGTWFYSLDNGASWSDLGDVSGSNSRLLAANPDTRLYFQPNSGYTGTIADAITFRAWDQTSGINGALANTVPNGNSTAFSTATDTASINVRREQKVDFNGDPHTDIVWWNELSGDISFWAMDGASLVYSRVIAKIPVSSGWVPVGIGDFTNDGRTDILWRNQLSGENGFWEMKGETSFQPYLIESEAVNSGWDVGGVGDFTNDGLADILWRNSITGQNRFWEMNGPTRVAVVDIQAEIPQSGWDIVGVIDFTGDGHTDILWRNRISGENRYWEMNGANFVEAHAIASVPVSSGWQVATVGDFNRDTEVDILWRNSNNGIAAFWLSNGVATPEAQLLLPTWEPASGWTIV